MIVQIEPARAAVVVSTAVRRVVFLFHRNSVRKINEFEIFEESKIEITDWFPASVFRYFNWIQFSQKRFLS